MTTNELNAWMGESLRLEEGTELPLTLGERCLRIALLLGFGAVLAIEAYLLYQVMGLVS
jgi:hypothetical protein